MISERSVARLLGNWERNEPPEARISVIDQISRITHGEEIWSDFGISAHLNLPKFVTCGDGVLRTREHMAGDIGLIVPIKIKFLWKRPTLLHQEIFSLSHEDKTLYL